MHHAQATPVQCSGKNMDACTGNCKWQAGNTNPTASNPGGGWGTFPFITGLYKFAQAEKALHDKFVQTLESELSSSFDTDKWTKYPYTVGEAFGLDQFYEWQYFKVGSGPLSSGKSARDPERCDNSVECPYR
jgi:hypothetical protein